MAGRRKKAAVEGDMRVRFLRHVPNFTPPEDRKVTWEFQAGDERTLRRTHGQALVDRGDAEAIDVPPRDYA